MGKVILTGKGRRWYLRGHPWIYKDDVATGDATPGELVPVEDPNGAPLGWGLFSSQSRIRVRMVTREAEQPTVVVHELRPVTEAVDPGGPPAGSIVLEPRDLARGAAVRAGAVNGHQPTRPAGRPTRPRRTPRR